eukprot:3273511-Rhodomonas_salina.2
MLVHAQYAKSGTELVYAPTSASRPPPLRRRLGARASAIRYLMGNIGGKGANVIVEWVYGLGKGCVV